MKHLLIAATASAMLLAACGDDSSTNASGNTLTRTASLFVDEEHQLIVITPDPYYENECVVEGEALTWKNVQQRIRADSMKYEFHGDTLLFYNIDDGDTSHYGEMWVGGTAGKIYGAWTYTHCEYYNTENDTRCYDSKYHKITYNISSGKVTGTQEIYFDQYLSDINNSDLTKSNFLLELYKALSGQHYSDVWVPDIFDVYGENNDDIEYYNKTIVDNGVNIIASTKRQQTFSIGDKTFTVDIKKVDLSLDGYQENRDISIDVTDGVTTCSATYIKKALNAELCKTENAALFDEDDYDHMTDNNGNEYIYVDRMRMYNEDEFDMCIKSIAVQSTENDDLVDYPANVLYKKASAQDRGYETRYENLLRKWAKYSE